MLILTSSTLLVLSLNLGCKFFQNSNFSCIKTNYTMSLKVNSSLTVKLNSCASSLNTENTEKHSPATLNLTVPSTSTKQALKSSQEWYGRITSEKVYLYASPYSDSISNAYFEIEPTYFVKLLDNANETYYKAQYLDLVGYVKKTDVKVTATTPQTPYLNNINFRIYSEISQTMRTVPSSSEGSQSQVCYLPYFCKDALYYGKIEGESAISGRTNIWYFCRYENSKAYYGYIYSDGCDQMKEYSPNTEIVEYVDAPNFNVAEDNSPLAIVNSNDKSYGLIIALISIPVAIFLIMIIRSGVILKSNKKEKAKEIKLFFDS